MVHRHEGVYDGRYKLINFYELKEWELYDLEKDPNEMNNQIENSEYAAVVQEMKVELQRLRSQYNVPTNRVQDILNVDLKYHSKTMRKNAKAKE